MHHDHCYELSRGVALAGRAIRKCVRDITDIGAGALVVPAPVGRGACMSTVPADFGRSWSRTAAEDGCTCDNAATTLLVLTVAILAAALCGRLEPAAAEDGCTCNKTATGLLVWAVIFAVALCGRLSVRAFG